MKAALISSGIFFCYIDDFYSANAEKIKHSTLFREMYRYINNHVQLNVNEIFSEALRATRIDMAAAEKKQFFHRYIRTMQMLISDDGNMMIEFKRK